MALPRPTTVAPARKREPTMRPPTRRPSTMSRAGSAAPPSRNGAISPAESVASVGTKRKAPPVDDGSETNINVVVRCRARNEREVKENSGVVLSTDGVRGSNLNLSMGPSAVSNKSYQFDKVFSQAADQSMVFDEVVTPILDEMIAGFNCTIFAYGQTGTGKTYTMSGDMTDTLGMLSDAAGIIPRALYSLFAKLEENGLECSVKCSFIELYNEELRDLISAEEANKLQIYEDQGKKGYAATRVHGMEETIIHSAVAGVDLLRKGSHRRQVAATKCNDLSSRSHTVFTVTAHVKRTTENGEDYVSAGKLNLVDLAGSENIQRSGAENKRAAEAGLINKSLLTLGRVINALVDKSSHIPYRESKLTRLLQDSLGGQTKTCIIATVSPAKSNLEETISTLDYAFRAKNIRNKPQVNQMVNKKVFFKDYTLEIERLKSELMAARAKHGVYLTNESFEEMNVEKESMKVLNEEQRAKIESMENNLQKKVQDLYNLKATWLDLKEEHKGTREQLDTTKSVLEQTEFVLNDTKQSLAEETFVREAHQQTEEKLAEVGSKLITTIGNTVKDVSGLHAKISRKSDLQAVNRSTWNMSQIEVSDVTSLVDERVDELKYKQEELMETVTTRMQSFVKEELDKLAKTQEFLGENVKSFEVSRGEVSEQTLTAKNGMDEVLEEIKDLRETVKTRVGEGLQGLNHAAERITGEVISEMEAFKSQLHTSYSSMGKEFKGMFEDLMKHVSSQKAEIDELRKGIVQAGETIVQANGSAATDLDNILREERDQQATEREMMMEQIMAIVQANAEMQEVRVQEKIRVVEVGLNNTASTFEDSRQAFNGKTKAWLKKEAKLEEDVAKSRERMKGKMQTDYAAANKHSTTIETVTRQVRDETVRIVDSQIADLATQMQSLDEYVSRAKAQNTQHNDQHFASLSALSSTVESSYANIGEHFTSSYDRVHTLGNEMAAQTTIIKETLSPVYATLHEPLAELRQTITGTKLREYEPTGETPRKQDYQYPNNLPRTAPRDILIRNMTAPPQMKDISASTTPLISPTKVPVIFHDSTPSSLNEQVMTGTSMVPTQGGDEDEVINHSSSKSTLDLTNGFRENSSNLSAGQAHIQTNQSQSAVPQNISRSVSGPATLNLQDSVINQDNTATMKMDLDSKDVNKMAGDRGLKRNASASGLKQPSKINKRQTVVPLEGKENVLPSVETFSKSVGAGGRSKRSPRNA